MSTSLFEDKYRIRTVAIVLLSIGQCVGLACYTSKLESNVQVANKPVAERTPDDLAEKLNKFYGDKNCKEFVSAFPDTFQGFDQLYGYDDEKGEHELTAKSEEHISYLFSCPEVPDLEKLDKAIKIGIGGKWDADAIGMFQDLTFNLVSKHSKETEEILNRLPDSKTSSFWYFLLDAPHPSDPERQRSFRRLSDLLGKQSKQLKMLVDQHQRILAEEKEDKNSARY